MTATSHTFVFDSMLLLNSHIYYCPSKKRLHALRHAAVEVAHYEVAMDLAVVDAHQKDLILVIGPLKDMFHSIRVYPAAI